ncbi:MAG: NTP transferase domain-containing protein [Burkholderiaceae bacterium]|nr:NTP transferase domain-containing protein [Burkholderiaceae bacterium]
MGRKSRRCRPGDETAAPLTYCTDGMGDSIASGVRATANSAGWLILPGDLPLIEPATLRLMAQALERHAIVVPHHRGRSGHPVGFRAECGSTLQTLSGDQGAAGIVHTYRARRRVLDLEVDDAGVFTDIDTLDDLAHAAALLSQCQSHKAAGSPGGISHGHD